MHFHCSHWQNHHFNFKFRERGPLVLAKTTFSSLFWNKLLIPQANCNGHVPFDMFHHKRSQNDTLGFFGRKYLSEQHWQMRHIRLHGCRTRHTLHILVNVIFFVWKCHFCVTHTISFCESKHTSVRDWNRLVIFCYSYRRPFDDKTCLAYWTLCI